MQIGGILPEFIRKSSHIGWAAKIAYSYLLFLSVESGNDEVDASSLPDACAMTDEEAAYSLKSLCTHHFIEALATGLYRIVDGRLLRDQYAKQEAGSASQS